MKDQLRWLRCQLSTVSLLCILLPPLAPTFIGVLLSVDRETGVFKVRQGESVMHFAPTTEESCLLDGVLCRPEDYKKGARLVFKISGALNARPLKASKIMDESHYFRVVKPTEGEPFIVCGPQRQQLPCGSGPK